jgi:hypothetical protein
MNHLLMIATIIVAQSTTNMRGRIKCGIMLPWSLKKKGTFECLDISRGPNYFISVSAANFVLDVAYEIVVELLSKCLLLVSSGCLLGIW